MLISAGSSDVCSSDLANHKPIRQRFDLQLRALGKLQLQALAQVGHSGAVAWQRAGIADRVAHFKHLPVHHRPRTDAQPAGFAIGRYALLDRVLDQGSEEHTSELQSLTRISYAVVRLNNKIQTI